VHKITWVFRNQVSLRNLVSHKLIIIFVQVILVSFLNIKKPLFSGIASFTVNMMKKNVVFLCVLLFFLLNVSGCSNNTPVKPANEPSSENNKGKRVALVICNGAYKIEPLTNPANDAHDMATVLRELGFEVTFMANVNKATTEKAIQKFQHKLREDDVGLFYYSGHGIQYKGENYIIPVGAMETISTIDKSEKEAIRAFKAQVVKIENVVMVMEKTKNKLNIVFLDAYRDNPFRSFKKSIASGWTSGLAFTFNADNTLIAYATSQGKGVLSSQERNSHFTEQLLHFIKQPLPIELMLKEVRKAVKKKTDGQQVPWYITSIEENFAFVPSSSTIPPISTDSKENLELSEE
jgi:uncharacterized caspase-like protein